MTDRRHATGNAKPGTIGAQEFRDRQDSYFVAADTARFRWMAEDPAFAPVEEALLRPWIAGLPYPCLEIGCGEGSNLRRLAARGPTFGLDRYHDRVRFASTAVPHARTMVGDALDLPFADATFASVVVRDLFHHLPDARSAATEAVRVLRAGGRLLVLEPNGSSLFAALQSRVVPAEIGVRQSTPARIAALFDGLPVSALRVDMAEPLALRRAVLHYRFGVPAVGRTRAGAALLSALERFGGRLVPRARWAYLVLTATRA